MERAPGSMTAAAVRDAVLARRAESLALRLLGGSGRPALCGYAPGTSGSCESVCHGLGGSGELLVAVVADDANPLTAAADHTGINVRLDIVKEAPEWAARITACTAHLLGTLEWLSEAESDEYRRAGDVPSLVGTVSALPGGRLGVIRADRVLLHDSAGVTPFAFAELAARHTASPFPAADEELSAREELGRLSLAELADLFALADAGWDAALPLTAQAIPTCPSLHGQVLCVDVDSTGLTLMQVDASGTRTALFPFVEPVASASELADRLAALVVSAWTHERLPRG